MQGGKLRHRVELQSTTGTADGYGQVSETWSTYATVWGSVEPLSGAELVHAQQIHEEITVRIRIRYNSSVESEHRIVHDSRTFEIIAVLDPAERNIENLLMCRELK